MAVMTSEGVVVVYDDDLLRTWLFSQLRPAPPDVLGIISFITLVAKPSFATEIYFVKDNSIREKVEIRQYRDIVIVIVNNRAFLGKPWLVDALIQFLISRDLSLLS